MVWALVSIAACLALGLFGSSKPEMEMAHDADISNAYMEHLVAHHEHLMHTKNVIGGLLHDGVQTMAHTKKSIESLVQSLSVDKFDF